MLSSTSCAPDDRDLVDRILAGDVRAFETVYDRHAAQLFSLAIRVTGRQRAAEEATQDAFLTLWRSPGRYDAARGTLINWLLAIVRHRSIDWLRRESRHDHPLQMDESLAGGLAAPERTDEQVIAREEALDARRLVLGLPAEQRQVVELAYFSGLTHREIAARVGIPLGTVKGRQRLAMTKMNRQLTRSLRPPALALGA